MSVNPTRGAILDVLRRMGAAIDETPIETPASGEPIADLAVRTGELRAVELEPSETARAIDEIPILCLAATQARGRSVIRGAGELRHKESDRIAGIVGGLRELGARISVEGDDVLIDGPGDLRRDREVERRGADSSFDLELVADDGARDADVAGALDEAIALAAGRPLH